MNIQAKENGAAYSVAFVGMSMDYREYDNMGYILDSEKSNFNDLVGGELGLDYVFNANTLDYSQIGLHITGVGGTTNYTGSLLSGNGGYGSALSNTKNIIIDMDGEYLFGFNLNEYIDLFGGASIGYRYWKRELSAAQIETYSWAYINPEAGLSLQATTELELRLSGGYKFGLYPVMNASGGINNTFNLGSANILHMALGMQYKINQIIALSIEYLYENQVIKKSNVVYGSNGNYYLEPDSTANNQYLKFGVAFKY